ncbi:AraC family transcriptional regulator [Streptomyces sp. NPDC058677]|uniref:helix-turn-helix transcriptional regulator n=1 Tax=Streptomyces sp. NPDC058677 TaxID=3346594 RepID=UPI0036643495
MRRSGSSGLAGDMPPWLPLSFTCVDEGGLSVTLWCHEGDAATSPPADEVDEQWRRAVRARVPSVDVDARGRHSGIALRERTIGDLLLTDWICPSVEGARRSSDARRDGDALLLITALSGVQVMHTADGTVVLRPGTLVLLSTRTPGRFVVPQAMAMRSLRVPAVALGLHDTAGRIPVRPVVRDDGNPLARLLLGSLAGIDCSIEQMTVTEIESTRGALLSLVAGIVRAGRSEVVDDGFPALLRRQLEAWIVDHLSLGAIRVADLAAAHSVAPRTVHRAFASTGDTVGSVVRSRRLAAARDDVVNTRRSIASIAQRWGFSDASHLGRQFRRAYGLSPGDYRNLHGSAAVRPLV